jgi:adenylate cyclase
MTQRTRRTRNHALFCVVFTGVCLALYWQGFVPLIHAELRGKDFLLAQGRQAGRAPELVFIGIDQPTYAETVSPEEAAANPALAHMTNNWPWSRAVWAATIELLANAGAKAIMLDLVLASPGPGDDELRAVLDKHADRVVIGANFMSGNKGAGEGDSMLLPGESVLTLSNGAAMWQDPRVGYVNFFADIDDVVRHATFSVTGEHGLPPDGSMKSLAARALEKAGAANRLPRSGGAHLFRFSAPPGLGYKPVPLYTLFLPDHWTNNFGAGKFFAGKIVMIGPAANIFHDEHRTPYPGSSMLGPEIHLNVIAAALRGEFLGDSSFTMNRVMIVLAGVAAFALALAVRGPIRRLFLAVAVIGLYWLGCWAAFTHANFFLIAFTPVIALSSSVLAGFAYDFRLLREEKNRTRRMVERYVSKDAVREILDNPDSFLNSLGGVRKPVTILFSDVRGFTTLTEGADAAQLVTQLNEYFNDMVHIVFEQQGRLDKFIGDAVMADWGSIVTAGAQEDARRAVATALDMRKYLARLNVNWKQRGITELSFGIGINHGEVIVGNLGSEQKMEVSVIGDAVNLASRLEGLTKEYKLDLLLGESMVPLVQDRFALRSVDSVQVKGKKKPVHVFTVVADKEAGEQSPAWLMRYEEGVAHYRARRFNDGLATFADCVRWEPEDYLSQLYLRRCQELVANPPGPDWDTVFVMKSK